MANIAGINAAMKYHVDRGFQDLARGKKVSRATDTLPQTGDKALFSVSGGRVLLLQVIGEVTTAIQNQENKTKLKFNPTGSGSDTDLCAVLNIADDGVGTYYGITGKASDALQAGVRTIAAQATPVILEDGDIELDCDASNTGSVKWDIWYIPLDEGATITAA